MGLGAWGLRAWGFGFGVWSLGCGGWGGVVGCNEGGTTRKQVLPKEREGHDATGDKGGHCDDGYDRLRAHRLSACSEMAVRR